MRGFASRNDDQRRNRTARSEHPCDDERLYRGEKEIDDDGIWRFPCPHDIEGILRCGGDHGRNTGFAKCPRYLIRECGIILHQQDAR